MPGKGGDVRRNAQRGALVTGGINVSAAGDVLINNNSFVGDISTSLVSVTSGTSGTGDISVLNGGDINAADGDITLTTAAVCPRRVKTSWPVDVSHNLTVRSSLAVAMRRPSGLQSMPRTRAVCPRRLWST